MGCIRTERRDGDFRHDGGVPAIGIANPTPDGGFKPSDSSLYPGVYGYGTVGGTDLFAFGTAGKISTTVFDISVTLYSEIITIDIYKMQLNLFIRTDVQHRRNASIGLLRSLYYIYKNTLNLLLKLQPVLSSKKRTSEQVQQ